MADYTHMGDTRPLDTAGGETLFRQTLDKFQSRLAGNRERALRQYGLTLYHSLSIDQRTKLANELGMAPDNAVTHYNLGMAALAQSDWEAAAREFEIAYKRDALLNEALYNQALATEKAGDKSKAGSLYEKLIETVRDEGKWNDDVSKIKAHLEELNAA